MPFLSFNQQRQSTEERMCRPMVYDCTKLDELSKTTASQARSTAASNCDIAAKDVNCRASISQKCDIFEDSDDGVGGV